MGKLRIIDILMGLVFASLLTTPVYADLDNPIDPDDKETFDKILEPIMKVYNFVKYSATVVAGLALLFTAITYMTSGSNIKKRESSKTSAGYVVIGLFIIWATPFAISFLI